MRRQKTTPPHLKEDVKPDAKTGAKKRKMVLGRGLDSLIPAPTPPNEGDKRYFECPINLIRPNQRQPRVRFSDDDLTSLSLSIREQGIIQPLIVRKDEAGYELVAGERRLRAAAHAVLAQAAMGQSMRALARLQTERAMYHAGQDPVALAEVAEVLIAQAHQPGVALDALRLARGRRPGWSRIYALYAFVYGQLRRLPRALQSISTALAIRPDYPPYRAIERALVRLRGRSSAKP